jgi:hypothetical protein
MRVRTKNDGIQFVALPIPAQRPTLSGRIQSWIRSASSLPAASALDYLQLSNLWRSNV